MYDFILRQLLKQLGKKLGNSLCVPKTLSGLMM